MANENGKLRDATLSVLVGSTFGVAAVWSLYLGLRGMCDQQDRFHGNVIALVKSSGASPLERLVMVTILGRLMEECHGMGHILADPIGAAMGAMVDRDREPGELEVN